jgi:hypothetical protein
MKHTHTHESNYLYQNYKHTVSFRVANKKINRINIFDNKRIILKESNF